MDIFSPHNILKFGGASNRAIPTLPEQGFLFDRLLLELLLEQSLAEYQDDSGIETWGNLMNFIELCISVMFIKLIYLIQMGESVAGHSQPDFISIDSPTRIHHYQPLTNSMNHSLYC
jgi:hypothetical protein